jgi:hypothetical protein
MNLVYVRDSDRPDSPWHRVDTAFNPENPTPMPRQAICTAMSSSTSDMAPWPVVWRRTTVSPPGLTCSKCDDLARRLTEPMEDMVRRVDPLRNLLGDDLIAMIESI